MSLGVDLDAVQRFHLTLKMWRYVPDKRFSFRFWPHCVGTANGQLWPHLAAHRSD
ncbi:hypothetical protein ACGLHS_07575 [Variovorax sp. VaC1]|uniref:hypothetical protein n=1 Tax=Variovorax sp. VaC1 TaxID=3373132 RepID=UPI003749D922